MHPVTRALFAFTATYLGCRFFGESEYNSVWAAISVGVPIAYLYDVHGLIFRKIKRLSHG